MSSIGTKFKNIRKQKKLTQAELAEGLVNRSYISQIEKGTVVPSYKTVVLLAERLGESVSYFVENQEIELFSITDLQKKIKSAQVHLELNDINKMKKIIFEIKVEDLFKLDEHEKGLYYCMLGEIFLFQEEWQESINYLMTGKTCIENSEDERTLIKCLNSLSKALMNIGNIEEALEVLNEANDLVIKNQFNDVLKIEVLLNLAVCHGRIGEFRSAIRSCKEAVSINQMTNNNYKSGEIFMTLGICYKKSGDLNKAKEFYLKAVSFFEIFESNYNKAGTLINLGILFRERQEYNTAINYIEEAKEIFQELEDQYQVSNCLVEIVRTYVSLKKFFEAKELSFKTLKVMGEDFPPLRKQIYELLSDISLNKSELKCALSYLSKAEELIQTNPDYNLMVKKARIYLELKEYKVAAELFESSMAYK